MPLILPANTLDSSYEISNSGRFNDGQTQALSKTHGASGNNKTFTFSCWVKFSDLKAGSSATECCHGLFASEEDSGYQFFISTDEGKFRIADYQSEYKLHLITNRLFRDYSAWYHFCIIFDTTQGTAADRCKLFVNGEKETSFSTSVYPTQDLDLYGNDNNTHYIGRRGGSNTMYFDGYMADVNFVDGTAVACTEFGERDSASGIWKPKKYSGSYGNNGFFLEFGNTGTGAGSGRFASDTSGVGNHYDTANFSGEYQMTDTPTNNWCTWNPLIVKNGTTTVFSKGNCDADFNDGSNYQIAVGSIAATNGKWYAEIKVIDDGTEGDLKIGVCEASPTNDNVSTETEVEYRIVQAWNGHKRETGSSATSGGTAFSTNNDIVGVYLDLDNGTIKMAVNGTMMDSGNSLFTNLNSDMPHGGWTFFAYGYADANVSANFGNSPHTVSSANADANGYGNFEYDPTLSGVEYYALNTKNLAEYG